MATLVSPGVDVQVIDESIYASVGTGTVPLIVIATGENKSDISGSGVAAYTVKSESNKLKLITSQRDLVQYYGEPFFEQVSGTSVHGGERNEYGLLTAYSFLGLANRAYVLRADVDLDQLDNTSTEPKGPPANNSLWFDLTSTAFGISQADENNNFEAVSSHVLTSAQVTGVGALAKPLSTYGNVGDFAIVTKDSTDATINPIRYYLKTTSTVWSLIDQTGDLNSTGREVDITSHVNVPTNINENDIWIKTTSFNFGMDIVVKRYDSTSESFADVIVPVLKDDLHATRPGTFNNGTLARATATIVGGTVTGFTITEKGSGYTTAPTVTFTNQNGLTISTATATSTINSKGEVTAISLTSGSITGITDPGNIIVNLYGGTIPSANSIYLKYASGTNATFEFRTFDGLTTASTPLAVGTSAYQLTSSFNAIEGNTVDKRYWYDNTINNTSIDLYIQNGGFWRPKAISSVGTEAPSAPVTNDVWIDTNDLDNFPAIKIYSNGQWVLKDNTDQTTPNGVIFGDITATKADVSNAGVGATLLNDDSPNPVLYPANMLAVNMCHTSNTVRQYDASLNTTWKWRNAAGNSATGAGMFGRKAVRKVIVKQLQEAVSSNVDIRSELFSFNLIACPGYPELADELSTLSTDRKETAFVVIDSPFRTTPQKITDWILGTSAVENGENGLVSPKNANMAVYYPSALGSNIDGQTVLLPPSYVSLRTIAYNDSVSYPWFAPAGLTRGIVSNATNVGYLDSEDEFVPLALNEGQRDSLYVNKVNPIANFPGTGIAIFGQKTLHPFSSSLDRINVSRLVIYLRERFAVIARPFIFEPNDSLTRNNIRNVFEGFMQEIVTKRGIYDYAIVCDESNNTPARIDRNELYIDIAVEPTKAAEFIYIPIRLVNTGDL